MSVRGLTSLSDPALGRVVGILAMALVACDAKVRPLSTLEPDTDDESTVTEVESSRAQPPDATPPTPLGPRDAGNLGSALDDQLNPPCGFDAGPCAVVRDAGGGACVPTGPRDCSSELDNDCDGRADNLIDEVCLCVPGSTELCDEHPGFDERGPCRAGSRACVFGEDRSTSDWAVCQGAVGPVETDSCAIRGDDANCDGTNNGDCPCVDGETQPCGPDTEDGICARGIQTCVGGRFETCVGAEFPRARNCSSPNDNDCDGRPDSTIDSVCTCAIGMARACGAHPGRDGNGLCRAGSQTCEGRSNNSTSTFGTCTGSVGPLPQDSCVEGNDGDCDGFENENCTCFDGATRVCGTTDVGPCQLGTQTCVNGRFAGCQGAVNPAPRNCGSPNDNDCDGRPDNTVDAVCECVPGGGNGPCSDDPNNARCGLQGQCVPCQVDADCSFVGLGRQFCTTGGQCVARFACGDASPRSASTFPVARLISSAAPSTGGTIPDGEYVQTDRFVGQLPANNAFTIGQSFAFRGQFVHFRWVEFLDASDPGGPLDEGIGTFTTSGNSLTIEYFNCLGAGSGSFTFQYSVSPTGFELISTTQGALSGRFVRR